VNARPRSSYGRERRHITGGVPISFLKARLKADSDSSKSYSVSSTGSGSAATAGCLRGDKAVAPGGSGPRLA
jgi:hypothetical protein